MGTSRWLRQYAARRTARTPNSPATTSAKRNRDSTNHCCQPSLLTSRPYNFEDARGALAVTLTCSLRQERDAESRERPIGFALDLRDEGEVARPVRADGVARRVALAVAVEAEFQSLCLAPLRVEDSADEVEDDWRTDRRAVAFGHEAARAPVFVDDAHEFAQGEIVVRVARAVDHACAPHVRGEGVCRRVVAVGRAVELPVFGKVARLARRLHADDAPLMQLVSFREY